MFCSNCGKKIYNGATFCQNCGQPLQNNNLTYSLFMGTPKELQLKKIVIGFYFAKTLIFWFLSITILATRFQFFIYFIDIYYSRHMFSEMLETIYNEYVVFTWLLAFVGLSVTIIEVIEFFIKYKKRCFSPRKKNINIIKLIVIVENVKSVLYLAIPIAVNVILSITKLGKASSLLWTVVIIIIAFRTVYTIFYYKACKCEEENLYNENYYKTKIAKK